MLRARSTGESRNELKGKLRREIEIFKVKEREGESQKIEKG